MGKTNYTKDFLALANANHCNQPEKLANWTGSAAVANVFVACARMKEPKNLPLAGHVRATTSARAKTGACILIHGTNSLEAAVASARIRSIKVVAVKKTRIARTAKKKEVASATLAQTTRGK